MWELKGCKGGGRGGARYSYVCLDNIILIAVYSRIPISQPSQELRPKVIESLPSVAHCNFTLIFQTPNSLNQ